MATLISSGRSIIPLPGKPGLALKLTLNCLSTSYSVRPRISDAELRFRYTDTLTRKMDMLNADLQMKNDVADSKKRKRKAQDDEASAAFHFIAFVPVDGKIWKLDGLERQPHKVGMEHLHYLFQ